MKRLIFCLVMVFFIWICLYLPVCGEEDEQLIFTIDDPLNDDYGPGTYKYPTNKVFQSSKGLFDLNSFSIEEDDEEYYLLTFKFNKLTDPWKSKYGFSLPLIELYIDNKEGGSTELFKEGANVRFAPGYPWDSLLKITGWWVRAFKPEDRNNEVSFWEMEENPWNIIDSRVEVKNNDIFVWIKEDLIGSLKGANLFLMIGSFDPFGPDHFRGIENKYSSWKFADLEHNNLTKAPRVLDIVLPVGQNQAEVLANFDSDYPIIYPIKVTNPCRIIFSNLKNNLLVLILILLCLTIFTMNKKDINRHNKN